MAISEKKEKEIAREQITKLLYDLVVANIEEDTDYLSTNKFNFPLVGCEGSELFCEITVKIPNGSRDGDPYDGYALREEYQLKLKEKEEKAKANAEKKAKKIKRDEEIRNRKKEIAEKGK